MTGHWRILSYVCNNFSPKLDLSRDEVEDLSDIVHILERIRDTLRQQNNHQNSSPNPEKEDEKSGTLIGVINPDTLNPDSLILNRLHQGTLHPVTLNPEAHNPNILKQDLLNPGPLNAKPKVPKRSISLGDFFNPSNHRIVQDAANRLDTTTQA